MADTIYRRRALERISTPEQLDRAVRVTSPQRWIALSSLLLVVLAALLWAFIATVPTKLTGPAYLLPLGGLREVEAPISGTLEELDVAQGDHVVSGQIVAKVRSPEGSSVIVTAPTTGVVNETDAVIRSYVGAGERLALVEPVGWPLVLYSYVPTDSAADLAPGTPVRIAFGAGIGDSFGFARGVVDTVSQFPATTERLDFTLQDAALVQQVRALGPANEVLIRLERSARTPSGLVWGRGSGSPAPLPAGIPASVAYITGSHHPIDNVLGAALLPLAGLGAVLR